MYAGMSYEDARDWQRREQGEIEFDEPTTPAFTADELAEIRHDHGDDAEWLVNEIMERSMAGRMRWLERENARLRSFLGDDDE